jgi:2-hydroxy-3-keto-5-methylthiopentenyl-1-phosphate phosphatase
VSDLSAAKETDLLFAKEGKGTSESAPGLMLQKSTDIFPDLVTFCDKQGLPYVKFRDFSEILEHLKGITSGQTSIDDLVAVPGSIKSAAGAS